MQTRITDEYRSTADGEVADRILRRCVHCGFCLATCPTYQELGDELDSPRGRIYLIKEVLEGAAPTARAQLHLDRCLTCRACETTCPSGVEYGKLLDIGRQVVDARVGRGAVASAVRSTVLAVLTRPALFRAMVGLGRVLRGLLPVRLRAVLQAAPAGVRPPPRHARRVLILDGCVQPALRPAINAAAARVLDRLAISAVFAREAGCCGALAHHLGRVPAGHDAARRNIDAWLPLLDAGAEAIVTTASGCGAMVRDYGWLLRGDPAYAAKASRVAAAARDIAEVIGAERATLAGLLRAAPNRGRDRIAWHAPCTLQHGQRLTGVVEALLADAGYRLTPVSESQMCCGSAGTYSILQPEMAGRLRARKIAGLCAGAPQRIASANIGCIAHLQAASEVPISHWVELLDGILTPEVGDDANRTLPERP